MADNKPRRRRRSPEQARTEILDAATELIARHGPDQVTLAQVATAVGVTHGLITHYFGTYRALASAVLSREKDNQRARIREQMRRDDGVPYATSMVDLLFAALGDERYVRLWAWDTLHTEHEEMAADGLRELVDVMEDGIATVLPGERRPSRARIETTVLLALSASYGYALGGPTWRAGLGHPDPDPDADATYRAAVTEVVGDYLQDWGGTR